MTTSKTLTPSDLLDLEEAAMAAEEWHAFRVIGIAASPGLFSPQEVECARRQCADAVNGRNERLRAAGERKP